MCIRIILSLSRSISPSFSLSVCVSFFCSHSDEHIFKCFFLLVFVPFVTFRFIFFDSIALFYIFWRFLLFLWRSPAAATVATRETLLSLNSLLHSLTYFTNVEYLHNERMHNAHTHTDTQALTNPLSLSLSHPLDVSLHTLRSEIGYNKSFFVKIYTQIENMHFRYELNFAIERKTAIAYCNITSNKIH